MEKQHVIEMKRKCKKKAQLYSKEWKIDHGSLTLFFTDRLHT